MAAALLSVLVLPACGSGSSGPLAVAAETTAEQATLRTKITERLTTNSLRQLVTTEGVFDRENESGAHRQTTSVPGLQPVLSEGIVVEDVVWLRSSLLQLAVGPRWVRVDLNGAGTSTGLLDAAASALRYEKPDATLDVVRDATKDATRIGDELIDGVLTTHYRAALDQGKAADILEPPIDTFTYRPLDVWVDEDDLIRQVRLDYGPNQTAQGKVVVTTKFSDFGAPVSVTPPPAAEVVEAKDVKEG